MNVSLTPYYEMLIEQRIESGRYGNASEIVREALRLLEERDRENEARLRDLRLAIQEGIDSGEPQPMPDAETLKRMARERRAARLQRTGKQG